MDGSAGVLIMPPTLWDVSLGVIVNCVGGLSWKAPERTPNGSHPPTAVTCETCAMARALDFQRLNPKSPLKAPWEVVCTTTQTLSGLRVAVPNPPSHEPLDGPVTTIWSTVDPSALFCVVA